MSWVVAIIVGLIIGAIAGSMKKEGDTGSSDLWTGLIGGVLGKLIFVSWLNIGALQTASAYSFMGMVWAAIGAIIVIAIGRSMK